MLRRICIVFIDIDIDISMYKHIYIYIYILIYKMLKVTYCVLYLIQHALAFSARLDCVLFPWAYRVKTLYEGFEFRPFHTRTSPARIQATNVRLTEQGLFRYCTS